MYYNRDLSWLEFNYRVLQEASSPAVPLYDRIKFLSIFSSNLDEFFSVRYPVIMAISHLKTKTQRKIDNDIPENMLQKIQSEIERQLVEFNSILKTKIIPDLDKNGIVLYYKQALQHEHIAEAREIFLSKVLSFVQPVFLNGDILEKFEPEANKLYMIITLKRHGESEIQHTIIKVPSDDLSRFYVLSPINDKQYVVFIDDIIKDNAGYIFPGFEIVGTYCIKFNRDADIDFEDDYRGNILKKIEKQLTKRAHGLPSRFVFDSTMPRNVQLYLSSIFGMDQDEAFSDGRYHNLKDLIDFPKFDKKLTYDEWKPLSLSRLSDVGDIFKVMEDKDILLHFPYHSFNSILSFFNQAAIDPDVNEIYITLYRVAADSLIGNALISAARNGKKVTVFIELKARFDEANNISWSKKMKEAGIKIIYSIPGIKVHTKIALVTKNNGHKRKSYAIISTGNFNELTARLYTDHTLLTTDPTTCSELLLLFHFLEKHEKPSGSSMLPFKKLYVSQFNLVGVFQKLIEKEIKKAKKKGTGFIRIKLNNLEEPGMIDLLYKASREGVRIQLIVRSICCLVPGIKGFSENIQVLRLVDRYLEHSRIFIFGEDRDAEVYIGSADWMTRNLYRRIELCTPINDPACRKELLDYFTLQWQQTMQLPKPENQTDTVGINNVQQSVYHYLKERV